MISKNLVKRGSIRDLLGLNMSNLHSTPEKSIYRGLEAAEKARKAEISHKNLMNALANCPIVASEDLERSDYNYASKSDLQRMKNARRRVHT